MVGAMVGRAGLRDAAGAPASWLCGAQGCLEKEGLRDLGLLGSILKH